MSYIIVDLDGTLILENDAPNQPLIDHLNDQVMSGEAQILIVSARKIDRLTETRAWLQEHGVAGVEEIHLNDFEGSAFATGLAFKEYKYGLLAKQYGSEIEYAVDNDAAVRDMARGLGIEAYTPEEALREESRAIVKVPAYVSAAATAGLEAYEGGLAGDGLQDQTVREARQHGFGATAAIGKACLRIAMLSTLIFPHRGRWPRCFGASTL